MICFKAISFLFFLFFDIISQGRRRRSRIVSVAKKSIAGTRVYVVFVCGWWNPWENNKEPFVFVLLLFLPHFSLWTTLILWPEWFI
jgi:hypothetical protein